MIKYFATAVLFLALFSCKKEPTTWQTDWTGPVAEGHLTLTDLIPAEYMTTNSDGYVSIVYHEPFYTFTIDTIIDLPDTTIFTKSAIGVPTIAVNPGFSYTDSYNQEYQLEQIELKQVRVKSGTLEVEISCPWPGASLVTFSFPKITYDGVPFERVYAMPAASLSNPSTVQETIDLTHHMMDLTGTSGNLINYLSAFFEMGSNESVTSYDITSSDSVQYKITFKDLKADYAKGYFGQYHFTDTVGIKLDFMKNITAGQIDIDSIDLLLTVKNGFNLIAQSKITTVKGMNTKTSSMMDLTFPLINTSLNINPASGTMNNFTPSEYPISVNSTNSNISTFIENMSDSIILGYDIEINPFGNVTAGSDEVFPESKFELFLDAEFPLDFGANQLTLVDSFEIGYENPESVYPDNGQFTILYSNAFPLEATAYFVLYDEAWTVLDTLDSEDAINAGTYNSTTYLTSPANGQTLVNLSETNVANLDLAAHGVMHVVFTTDQAQKVKIGSAAYFDFILKSNLQVNIEL